MQGFIMSISDSWQKMLIYKATCILFVTVRYNGVYVYCWIVDKTIFLDKALNMRIHNKSCLYNLENIFTVKKS